MISPVKGIEKYISENGLSAEVVHSSGGNTASKSNLLYVAGFELYKSGGAAAKFDATKYASASEELPLALVWVQLSRCEPLMMAPGRPMKYRPGQCR
jgi:hypothetical protein